MKKFSLIFIAFLVTFCSFSQTTVNKDGTIKFRGNVAIIVDSKFYTFQNGKARTSVDNELAVLFKTTLRALCMEKFQNMAFGVVNRDDEASRQVEELIKENKLEDYLDGISVQAKNQGADWLYLIEAAIYSENNNAAQIEISTRLMNVENNLGYHYISKSNAFELGNEEQMRREIRDIVEYVSESLEQSLLDIFPEQYVILEAKGKYWTLGAVETNGRILQTDKFHAFRFQNSEIKFDMVDKPATILILDKVATCQYYPSKNGQFVVKSDKQVSDVSNIVLFRNVDQPLVKGTNQMRITFFGLNSNKETYDGFINWRINNAVFDAITRHSGLQLIEHDHLPSLKQERELQKGEDFIDGHVVEQMKAIGADYLIKLEDCERNEGFISLKISIISVSENRIMRTVEVKSSIDNVENELYKQLCERFGFPCVIKKLNKNQIELSSVLSLRDGDDCILQVTKEIKNPMTGEISYNRVDVCSLKFETYKCNKCIMSIDKVFSENDMANLEELSTARKVFYRIDGTKIKSNVSKKTDVQKKSQKIEKREKTKRFLNVMGNALRKSSSTKISISTN